MIMRQITAYRNNYSNFIFYMKAKWIQAFQVFYPYNTHPIAKEIFTS